MRRKLFFAALIVVVLPPATALAQTPCPPLKQIAAIKLERVGNSWTVPVKIEGVPKHMIFSPGLGGTFLTSHAAEELKLSKVSKRNPLLPIPGSRIDYASVKSLVLATGQFTDSEFQIVPMSGPDASNPEIAGAIGLDLLTRFDFDIDMASMTLNLFSSEHCEGQVVYWKTDAAVAVPISYDSFGQLRVPVTLDGVNLSAALNLGSEANRAALGIFKTKMQVDERATGVEQLPDETAIDKSVLKVYRQVFKTLDIGGLQIQNAAIEMRGTGAAAGSASYRGSVPVGGVVYTLDIPAPADLVIGTATLSKLRFFLASKERKLYISPAVAAPAAPAP